MRRNEARLGKLERAVKVAVHAELEAFLTRLEAHLDRPTYERVLEITAGFAVGRGVPLRKRTSR